MREPKQAPVKLDVRMPVEVREQLEQAARAADRSATQQTIHYIRRGIEADTQHGDALARIEHKLDRLIALLEKR